MWSPSGSPCLILVNLKTLIYWTNSLQQIRMAEIEQASLKSEQLSDKSSSPALPDDLSLDEHTFHMLAQESKVSTCRVGLKEDTKRCTYEWKDLKKSMYNLECKTLVHRIMSWEDEPTFCFRSYLVSKLKSTNHKLFYAQKSGRKPAKVYTVTPRCVGVCRIMSS